VHEASMNALVLAIALGQVAPARARTQHHEPSQNKKNSAGKEYMWMPPRAAITIFMT